MRYLFAFLFFFFALSLSAQPKQMVIRSSQIGRPVDVFLFSPKNISQVQSIIYVTDGKKFMDNGLLEEIEKLQNKGEVPPAHYVFVSAISPTDQVDYRNEYFFCNPDYLAFFREELIPQVEKKIGQTFTQDKRSLIGISFWWT